MQLSVICPSVLCVQHVRLYCVSRFIALFIAPLMRNFWVASVARHALHASICNCSANRFGHRVSARG